MEVLVASVPRDSDELTTETMHRLKRRPSPFAGGCRVEGFVQVKRIPGNLVFTARSKSHSFEASQINVSHVINHFSFGKSLTDRKLTEMKRLIPFISERHDPLSGQSYIVHRDYTHDPVNITIEHYLQVVKTEIVSRTAQGGFRLIDEYEYTAHNSLGHSQNIPVAKFHYEPSAMQVVVTEVPKSFSHFITNLCAIIGGVFTVAGILDAILHNTMQFLKKMELGKHM